jgi:hypothetical protein
LDGRLGGGEAGAFGFEGDDDVVGDVEDGAQRVSDGSVSEGVDGFVGVFPLSGMKPGVSTMMMSALARRRRRRLSTLSLASDDAEGDFAAGLLDLVGPFDAGALWVY